FTFILNYRIIEEEGPTSAATVGYLLPVVSVALGALVLGESLTPRVVAGMAVVLAGVALTRVALSRAKRDHGRPGPSTGERSERGLSGMGRSASAKRPGERTGRYQLSVMSTERDGSGGRSAGHR
ncbi:DMT family transporter, partial [Actinosynnema sp. NPDC023658]|uniref:DMT family transporter n=1 Tax=Actinosynnema sp. NPDC023658 TaxID=3155465 RepID=UPI0033F3BF07